MESITYLKIESENQIKRLANIAREIWFDYFGPMFEKDTLAYLFNQVQSKKAISNQIKEGYLYYLIETNGRQIGYFAYKLDTSKRELFLSKLYILSSKRGKGFGKQVIYYLEEVCKSHKITNFTLTVFHKNQNAIRAYEKMGFKIQGPVNRDIGNGIVIFDYKMEKTV